MKNVIAGSTAEHLAAAGKDFVPSGSGDPAELASALQCLVLPEGSLPYIRVCLAHPFTPKLDLLQAPLGVCEDSRCFWAGLEQCPVDVAELPTHRDMGEALPWGKGQIHHRATWPVGAGAFGKQTGCCAGDRFACSASADVLPLNGVAKLSGDARASWPLS